MATDILVPILGESVPEATVSSWLVKPGDALTVDQPVVELETEKATLEIGAPASGVLTEVLVAEGEDVAVGAVLGRIDETARAQAPSPSASTPASAPTPAPTPPATKAPPASAPGAPAPAAAVASAPSQGPDSVPRRGAGGSVTAGDLRAFLGLAGPTPDLARSGPAARKWMADHALAAGDVAASGRDGRITKGDVIDTLAAQTHGAAQAPAATGRPREERVKMGRLRRTIATRLKQAQQTAAILTTFNEIDMSAVLAARSRHREEFESVHGVRLGFTAFFAKACVSALEAIPEVNAEIDGEEIVYKRHYDIGMAVSAPNGLVVPVIRDCDQLSFAGIELRLAELAGKARDGKLTPDEMSGGTFTISNGGVFGSMLSTPILNSPQSGILGLHKIEERPMAVDGQVVIRPMMYVALSYDHRIVDGKGAVTFLVHVKQAIENPERLLLGL